MSHGSLLSTKEADLVRGEARHEHERRVARRRRQAQRARMQRAAPRQRLALLRRQRRRRDAHGREARARRRSSTTPDPPRRERHEAPQHGDGQPFWLLLFTGTTRIAFTRPILSGYLTKINETRIVKLR